MDSDFLLEVAVGIGCGLLCLLGEAVLAHPISRRWNPDWDGFFADGPLYVLTFLGVSLGLLGYLALMLGLLGSSLLLVPWRLSGRTIREPYNEPLPPLPKNLRRSAILEEPDEFRRLEA